MPPNKEKVKMSPAKTAKQRKAMSAEYGRRKRGLKPKMFKGMTLSQLREWITGKKHG